MDLDQFELAVQESTKEVEFLAGLKRSLGEKEFESLIRSTFRRYINNEEVISKLIDIGSHTWELSVILEMEKEEWFPDALTYLTHAFRTTMHLNRKQCIFVAERLYPDIDESLACWHDAFFLQQNIDTRNPRHAVRAYFRMLGDMIESALKPHIEFIYQILRLNSESAIYDKPENASLGSTISNLLEVEQLEKIYKSNLFGVSLGQWRNIAQHSNYRVNKRQENIICTYGSGAQHEIRLSVDELLDLLLRLNKTQALQKVAVSFFLVEFMNEIQFDRYCDINVTIESIISQIGNGLGLDGFKVSSVKDRLGERVFRIEDSSNKGLDEFKKTISRIVHFMAMLEDAGHVPVLELYSLQGKKLTEARVQRKNANG
jgi:hypothetical protein